MGVTLNFCYRRLTEDLQKTYRLIAGSFSRFFYAKEVGNFVVGIRGRKEWRIFSKEVGNFVVVGTENLQGVEE